MRIKDGFILRKLPGMNMVMPAGKNVKTFNGALLLNDTGAFIFERLQQGETVEAAAKALTAEYDVTEAKALSDVKKTVAELVEAGVAEA